MTSSESTFETPILFIVFSRPDLTQTVLESIRRIAPKRLYVAADGPRNSDEQIHCERTWDVIRSVDWDCEVKTLFRDENLGCKLAVSTAIGWFFQNEEEGIILEDDCLPNPSFYRFCSTLLGQYRNDERIMAISGDCFVPPQLVRGHSYRFSAYPHIWGWATWARAWATYDVSMQQWPTLRDTAWLENHLGSVNAAHYWRDRFDEVRERKIDTWDYQWVFAIWVNSGLTVIPNTNLVTNIGFDQRATHTKAQPSESLTPRATSIPYPLVHPPAITRDYLADRATLSHCFVRPRSRKRWFRTAKRWLKKMVSGTLRRTA